MYKKALFLILSMMITLQVFTQEIYCNVQVNTQQLEGTERKVFETLRSAIFEFVNNRQWTGYRFGVEERIECTILLNITNKNSSDDFSAELNIALKRPVF